MYGQAEILGKLVPMHRFPYITDYVNDVFADEKTRLDFILLRPLLLVAYFLIRTISFPIKFVFHLGHGSATYD
jgi:hypothetical protein